MQIHAKKYLCTCAQIFVQIVCIAQILCACTSFLCTFNKTDKNCEDRRSSMDTTAENHYDANHTRQPAANDYEQSIQQSKNATEFTVFTQIQIKAAPKISTKPSVAETTEKLKTNQRTSPSITCVPPNSRQKIQDYCWVLT